MTAQPPPLRIGTRASLLAQWQARWVAAELARLGVPTELVPVATSGDQQQTPIGAIGGQGLFTKEIQRELLDGRVDLAVHSLKDLPTEATPGLDLAAVPCRGPVADALVSRRAGALDQLPPGAVLGTGSVRRRAQLLHARADLKVEDIRGNVDTRLRKLASGQYDAIILAEAGLRRLDRSAEITEILSAEVLLPAPGQGALGLEIRADDSAARRIIEQLDHAASRAAVTAERALLHALRGGCLAPIAAWARSVDGRLRLTGRVLSPDGAERLEVTRDGQAEDASSLGHAAADRLLDQGAAALVALSRKAD